MADRREWATSGWRKDTPRKGKPRKERAPFCGDQPPANLILLGKAMCVEENLWQWTAVAVLFFLRHTKQHTNPGTNTNTTKSPCMSPDRLIANVTSHKFSDWQHNQIYLCLPYSSYHSSHTELMNDPSVFVSNTNISRFQKNEITWVVTAQALLAKWLIWLTSFIVLFQRT